ncbi:MAG: methyltransferase domain-containing protein [Rhodanobacteraceae bacterium]|nr:methyltransferase domain-containing protein [Rhodanobacteraceae bacterium]
MFANSRPVDSSQSGVHPRLMATVQRHLDHPFRRPVAEHSRRAFDELASVLAADSRPRVLDSGCGTGASTLRLAPLHADAVVIGVDKSAQRLGIGQRQAKAADAPRNMLLLRCDLVDFWLLAAAARWRFTQQYLLYPNPWPKPEHLQRRWAAHPVLPSLLACGGQLELRTNWKIYAQEWSAALGLAGISAALDCCDEVTQPDLTPFEAKYRASGHVLWRVRADAAKAAAAA